MTTYADFGIDTRGKNSGELKTQCPQCSPHRKKKNAPCLNVNLDKGVWHCWHCEWAGGLGDKKMIVIPHKKVYKRPETQAQDLSDKAIEWFAKRGIGADVLAKYKIATGKVYMPQVEEEVSAIQFPYYRNGELINIKHRDSKKNFRMESGAERVLYGIDDIDEITIFVEGEIDKLSLAQAGFYNCVSVPDGAPAANTRDYSTKFEFLETAAEKLAKVSKFIIAVDNDEPGIKLEEELARRLGVEKCLRVVWPEGCKDANEVLVKHGAGALRECLDNAGAFPIDGVFEVNDIEGDVDQLFINGYPKGESTGWANVDKIYTVHAGQWTVITGIPSHGKSEFMDAMAFNLAEKAGWVIGVYSAENQPIAFHVMKLIEKFCHKRNGHIKTDSDEYAKAKEFVGQHFKFIAQKGDVSVDGILARARQLVLRHGIRGLVIDPWNELDHNLAPGQSETLYISQEITKIRKFARENQVHVWLVAHPKSLQKDKDGNYPVPRAYDISGSAHWNNKADNCLAIWRDPSNTKIPTSVYVQKVRFRWVGSVGEEHLWYVGGSGRYTDQDPSIYAELRG